MRLLLAVLAGAGALAAQSADDTAAKLRVFEQRLAHPLQVDAVRAKMPAGPLMLGGSQWMRRPLVVVRAAPHNQPCAVPLLGVGPDARFQSNMPVIVPDAKTAAAAGDVISPGPVCEEAARK
jgi:hypothetical protein